MKGTMYGFGWLRRLYSWTMGLAAHRHAERALFGVSFAESSFFPIPPDVMLVPMVLADRKKAWRLAGICTLASVLGGIAGYAIGYLLYDTVGAWVVRLYGLGEGMEAFRTAYAEYGAWIILIKGLTPIPYKLVTIASGLASYHFGWFVLLSIITRGLRFYMVAGLLYYFGEPIREFIEKRLEWVMMGLLVAIVGGFFAFELLL